MQIVDLTFWQDVPAKESFLQIRDMAASAPSATLRKFNPHELGFVDDDTFFCVETKAVGKRFFSEEDGVHFWRVTIPDRYHHRMFLFDMLDPSLSTKDKKDAFESVMAIMNDHESDPPIYMLTEPLKECKNPGTLSFNMASFLMSVTLPYALRNTTRPKPFDFEVPTEEPKATLFRLFMVMLRGEYHNNKPYLPEHYQPVFRILYKYSVQVNNLFISKTLQHNAAYTYLADPLEKAIYKVFVVLLLNKFVKLARVCSAVQRSLYAPSSEELKDILDSLSDTDDLLGFSSVSDMPENLEYAMLLPMEDAKKFFENEKEEPVPASEESSQPEEDEFADVLKFSRKSDKVS